MDEKEKKVNEDQANIVDPDDQHEFDANSDSDCGLDTDADTESQGVEETGMDHDPSIAMQFIPFPSTPLPQGLMTEDLQQEIQEAEHDVLRQVRSVLVDLRNMAAQRQEPRSVPEPEMEGWVACEACNQWRKVTVTYSERVEHEEIQFVCNMLPGLDCSVVSTFGVAE